MLAISAAQHQTSLRNLPFPWQKTICEPLGFTKSMDLEDISVPKEQTKTSFRNLMIENLERAEKMRSTQILCRLSSEA